MLQAPLGLVTYIIAKPLNARGSWKGASNPATCGAKSRRLYFSANILLPSAKISPIPSRFPINSINFRRESTSPNLLLIFFGRSSLGTNFFSTKSKNTPIVAPVLIVSIPKSFALILAKTTASKSVISKLEPRLASVSNSGPSVLFVLYFPFLI